MAIKIQEIYIAALTGHYFCHAEISTSPETSLPQRASAADAIFQNARLQETVRK